MASLMDRQSRPLAPRSKTGCLTCRRRHKKCDEIHPVCTGCTRNRLICCWPAESAPAPGYDLVSSPAPSQASCAVPPLVRGTPMLPPLFRDERNSSLLQHFAMVTSVQLASRIEPENAFLTYNLRMAWGCDALQHAILAISSCHLSYMRSSSITSSLNHYAVALRGLKHALTNWAAPSSSSMDRILIVATSLVLCQYEVLNANTEGSLYRHLRALKLMVSELERNQTGYDRDLLGFFIEQYYYLAIVSHIGFEFSLEQLDRNLEDASTIRSLATLNKDTTIYGFLFGRAHHLFALIPRIHNLTVQFWHERRPLRPEIEAKYMAYELDVLCWDGQDNGVTLAYQLAGRIYQQTLLIFLYLGSHGPQPPTTSLLAIVNPLIDAFLEYCEELPYDALTWTATMWPFLV
ncbi:hypothetical protein ACJ41O_003406 [Fusarium nematophilum]